MACIIDACLIRPNGISHILHWLTLQTRAILCLFKYFGSPKGPQGPGCQGHPEICPLKTHYSIEAEFFNGAYGTEYDRERERGSIWWFYEGGL